jgi:NTE family protein
MSQKVALVLSGGGARGIAHIGVIETLLEQGYTINSIAGTSMGALVGGVYALGKLNEFKEWLFTIDKIKMFRLVDFSFSSHGLIKGDKVMNTMKEFISDAKIESLPIAYAAVAADLTQKEEVVYTTGSIYDAIRASIAIPTVLTPVKNNGNIVVDGGVVNNIPINRVSRTQGDKLIVVNVNADVPVIRTNSSPEEDMEKESAYMKKIVEFKDYLFGSNEKHHEEKLGYFDVLNMTIGLMTKLNERRLMEKFPPDLLINISHDTCTLYDFYRAEELVAIGRKATENALSEKQQQSA